MQHVAWFSQPSRRVHIVGERVGYLSPLEIVLADVKQHLCIADSLQVNWR